MHSRYGKRESGFSALSVLIALALIGTLGYIHLTGQLTVFHGVLGFIGLLGLFGLSWLQSEQKNLKAELGRLQKRYEDERRSSQEAERAYRFQHNANTAEQYRSTSAKGTSSGAPAGSSSASTRSLNSAGNRNDSANRSSSANDTLLMHSAVLSGSGGSHAPSSRDSCRSAHDSDSSRSWDSGSHDSSSSHSSSSDSSSSSSDSSCGGGGD